MPINLTLSQYVKADSIEFSEFLTNRYVRKTLGDANAALKKKQNDKALTALTQILGLAARAEDLEEAKELAVTIEIALRTDAAAKLTSKPAPRVAGPDSSKDRFTASQIIKSLTEAATKFMLNGGSNYEEIKAYDWFFGGETKDELALKLAEYFKKAESVITLIPEKKGALEDLILEHTRKIEEANSASTPAAKTTKTPKLLSQSIQEKIDGAAEATAAKKSNPTDADRIEFLTFCIDRDLANPEKFAEEFPKKALDFKSLGKVDLAPLDAQTEKTKKELDRLEKTRQGIVPDNLYNLDLQLPKLVAANPTLSKLVTTEKASELEKIIRGGDAVNPEYEKVRGFFGENGLNEQTFAKFFEITEDEYGTKKLLLRQDEIEVINNEAIAAFCTNINGGKKPKALKTILTSDIGILPGTPKSEKALKDTYLEIGTMLGITAEENSLKTPDGNDRDDKPSIRDAALAKFTDFFAVSTDNKITKKDGKTPASNSTKVVALEAFVAYLNRDKTDLLAGDLANLITGLKGAPLQLSEAEIKCFAQVKKVLDTPAPLREIINEVERELSGKLWPKDTAEDIKSLIKSSADFATFKLKLEELWKEKVPAVEIPEDVAAALADDGRYKVMSEAPRHLDDFYEISHQSLKLKSKKRAEVIATNSMPVFVAQPAGALIPPPETADFELPLEVKGLFSPDGKYSKMLKNMVPEEAILIKLKIDETSKLWPKGATTEEKNEASKAATLSEFQQSLTALWQKKGADIHTSASASALSEVAPSASVSASAAPVKKPPEPLDPVKQLMMEFVIASSAAFKLNDAKAWTVTGSTQSLESLKASLSSKVFRDLYDQSLQYAALENGKAYKYLTDKAITDEDIELYTVFSKACLSTAQFFASHGEEVDLIDAVTRELIVGKANSEAAKSRKAYSLKAINNDNELTEKNGELYKFLSAPRFTAVGKEISQADLLIRVCKKSDVSSKTEAEGIKKVGEFLESLQDLKTSFERECIQKNAPVDGEKNFEEKMREFKKKFQKNIDAAASAAALAYLNTLVGNGINTKGEEVPSYDGCLITGQEQNFAIEGRKIDQTFKSLIFDPSLIESFFEQALAVTEKKFKTHESYVTCYDASIVDGAKSTLVKENRQSFDKTLAEKETEYLPKLEELESLGKATLATKTEVDSLTESAAKMMEATKAFFSDNYHGEDSETAFQENSAEYKLYSYLGLPRGKVPTDVRDLIQVQTAAVSQEMVEMVAKRMGGEALVEQLRKLEADKKTADAEIEKLKAECDQLKNPSRSASAADLKNAEAKLLASEVRLKALEAEKKREYDDLKTRYESQAKELKSLRNSEESSELESQIKSAEAAAAPGITIADLEAKIKALESAAIAQGLEKEAQAKELKLEIERLGGALSKAVSLKSNPFPKKEGALVAGPSQKAKSPQPNEGAPRESDDRGGEEKKGEEEEEGKRKASDKTESCLINAIELIKLYPGDKISLSKETFGERGKSNPVLEARHIKELVDLVEPIRLNGSMYGGLTFDFKDSDPKDVRKFLQSTHRANFRSCTIKNLDLEAAFAGSTEEKGNILGNFSTVRFTNCTFESHKLSGFRFKIENIRNSPESSNGLNPEVDISSPSASPKITKVEKASNRNARGSASPAA